MTLAVITTTNTKLATSHVQASVHATTFQSQTTVGKSWAFRSAGFGPLVSLCDQLWLEPLSGAPNEPGTVPTSQRSAAMGDITMVEETLKRISSHKGILGVVIVNADGIPIRSTFENNVAVQYASLASHFTMKSRSAVKQLSKNDPEEELQLIRIRSKKHEIMIAPDFDKAHEYQLIVVQNPSTA